MDKYNNLIIDSFAMLYKVSFQQNVNLLNKHLDGDKKKDSVCNHKRREIRRRIDIRFSDIFKKNFKKYLSGKNKFLSLQSQTGSAGVDLK